MAITIVEDLWGRIRAHIDDKITAATAASESAVAAKTAAEAAATEVQETAANAAAVAAANVATELQDLTDRAETAATTATTAVAAEVEKLKGDAPEAFDTLGEIAAELAANETERSALTNSIAAKADKVHTHTALQISDATTVGRDVLTAESEAAARSVIGAGTSNLTLGTTASTAAAGDHTHTALGISDATATGRSVLTASSAADARQAIGAGTSSLTLGSSSSTAAAGNHTHSQYATTTVVDTKVTGSTSGMELWSGTQAQYDALPSATRTRAGFVAVIY